MAIMCERVRLPPISSFDIAISKNIPPTRYAPENTVQVPVLKQTHALYYNRGSWDASDPSTSGGSFPPSFQQDVRCVKCVSDKYICSSMFRRPRPSIYDPSLKADLSSPQKSAAKPRSPQPVYDRRPHSSDSMCGGSAGFLDR